MDKKNSSIKSVKKKSIKSVKKFSWKEYARNLEAQRFPVCDGRGYTCNGNCQECEL